MNMERKWGCIRKSVVLFILFCSMIPFSTFALPNAGRNGHEAPSGRNSETDLSIICINVSRGDSTLIISPTGATMLIDTGQTGDEVLETLNDLDISTIDYLVSTHYDSDHIGGTDRIVAGNDWEYGTDDDISIGVALDRGDEAIGDNIYIDDYLYSLDYIGCPRQEPKVGDVIDMGGGVEAVCVCINGIVIGGNTTGWELSENARSLGYLITFGTFEFLVCGDLLWYVEEILGEALYGTEVDVLHLNHHGSYSSTSWDFVEAIWPENAVVSVGTHNSYGHPHQEVIDNLNYVEGPSGEPWFQNAYITEWGSGNSTSENLITVHGDIEIITDGSAYSIDGDTFPTDELDTDSDGMPDVWEMNMGLDRNSSMDAQDDRDGDGLSELEEWLWWTSPFSKDTDGDEMPDGWEVAMGLDPAWDDAAKDMDGDGLSNIYEYNTGTDADSEDTDGDGLDDREEVFDYGTSPLVNDTDGDTLTDFNEIRVHATNPISNDTDRDGIGDAAEMIIYGTDPSDSDTDHDSMPDGWEVSYGLDPLSPKDAGEDADGDNVTNLDEYIAGTEPGARKSIDDLKVSQIDDDPDDDEDDDGENADDTTEGEDENGENGGERKEKDGSILLYAVLGVIVLFFIVMVILFIRGARKE